MRKSRFAEEQIIGILREQEADVATAEVCCLELELPRFRGRLRGLTVTGSLEFPRFRGHLFALGRRCPHAEDKDPVPADFRDQILALARSGRSVESLAQEFEPCAATIAGWVRQAGLDGGARSDGVTSTEREELQRDAAENRQLRVERDILSKAAAWFARNDVMSSRSCSS